MTNLQIQDLARPLFSRYGLSDVGALIKTAVAYRKADGHVRIDRITGAWSWDARPASSSVTSSRVVLSFPADYRRDTAAARARIVRQLEDLLDDADLAPSNKTGAQLDREIAAGLSRPR